MNKITYKNDWNGGDFYLDGEWFKNIGKKPKATLMIDGFFYPAEYQLRSGSDDDMGRNYSWTRTDIGILDGVIKQRFLSVRELGDKEVFIEFTPTENYQ